VVCLQVCKAHLDLLAHNVQTAKTLRLEIPAKLLALADKVIE
jgi:hypothetical protein